MQRLVTSSPLNDPLVRIYWEFSERQIDALASPMLPCLSTHLTDSPSVRPSPSSLVFSAPDLSSVRGPLNTHTHTHTHVQTDTYNYIHMQAVHIYSFASDVWRANEQTQRGHTRPAHSRTTAHVIWYGSARKMASDWIPGPGEVGQPGGVETSQYYPEPTALG
ncbi:unnamed protein product [Protopolystoma xenopodis]|uniref:Uncharacterized protein n=1 Tax=Protopolystoma xenopodis TaxID=117903 RepID=A0A3S5FFV2_9PLAT|nr:unnamed protein product [Protopolystoma xenopodis]